MTQQVTYDVIQGFLDEDGAHYAGDRMTVDESTPESRNYYGELEACGALSRVLFATST